MPTYQNTVILFLIDSKGVPRFGAEKYLCSLIETPQSLTSFSPAKLTFDSKKIRADIIERTSALNDADVLEIESLRTIGEAIWDDLGMSLIFDRLLSKNSEVTFLTNDPAIPWEWAWPNEREASLCQLRSCGNVFFEQLQQATREARSPKAAVSQKEQIAKMKAILLFDKGGHNRQLKRLNKVEEEIHAVRDTFLNAGLDKNHIKCIDGSSKYAEPTFLRSVREMREDLGIIHYAGHIVNGVMHMKHSNIDQEEIHSIFANKRNNLPRTLVFINGCESGAVPQVWDKTKNLSTAWLDAGASAILGSRLLIEDHQAKGFATEFYNNLLSPKYAYESLGEVLKETRNSLTRNLGAEVAWLQYTLFGHPYLYFFQSQISEEEVKASLAVSDAPSALRDLIEATDTY